MEYVETFIASVFISGDISCTTTNYGAVKQCVSLHHLVIKTPQGDFTVTADLSQCHFLYNVYEVSEHVHWFKETLIYQVIGQS